MTVVEVAEFLFVSRAHVKKLVESGTLNEVMPRNPNGSLNIDAASVEKYKAQIDAAKQAWCDFDTDDGAPTKY